MTLTLENRRDEADPHGRIVSVEIPWDSDADTVVAAFADLMVAATFHPDSVRRAFEAWVEGHTAPEGEKGGA